MGGCCLGRMHTRGNEGVPGCAGDFFSEGKNKEYMLI